MRPILLSLSCLLLASCGQQQADKPDLSIAPKPCPPSLEADLTPKPVMPDDAGIVKPPVGSKTAEATRLFLNDEAALNDWADAMFKRASDAKTFCTAG